MFLKVITVFFIGFFSLTLQTFGQSKAIVEVHFSLSHSRRIPDHHVTVEFQKLPDSVSIHVVSTPLHRSPKWDSTKRDYSFSITKEIFDKVATAVRVIDAKDILNDSTFTGYDGETCEITFGNYNTAIEYSVWAPDFNTQQRHLQQFLDACILILQTARLNPDKIL